MGVFEERSLVKIHQSAKEAALWVRTNFGLKDAGEAGLSEEVLAENAAHNEAVLAARGIKVDMPLKHIRLV